MKEHPLVSISCITYNHEEYIRDCLNGFIIQKCDFDFEVLIHDDASTDGTQDIIKEYQEKYPEIIKPILRKENQYSKGIRGIGVRYNFSRAEGRYLAMCEGDDYWIDPLKLQKQMDFMEANPEYTLCGHDRYKLLNGNLEIQKPIRTCFTPCMFFKREVLDKPYYDNYGKVFNGDTFLYFYLKAKGEVINLDFIGSVYRPTGKGIYTSINWEQRYRYSFKTHWVLRNCLKSLKTTRANLILREVVVSWVWISMELIDRLKEKNKYLEIGYVLMVLFFKMPRTMINHYFKS